MRTVHLKRAAQVNIAFKYIHLTLTTVSGLLLVPYYLHHLSADTYGAWLTVATLVAWFAVLDPGIANILIQKVSAAFGTSDYNLMRAYVNAGIVASGIVALAIFSIGAVLAPVLIRWLEIASVGSDVLVTAFRVACASASLFTVTYALTGVLQGLQRPLCVGVLLCMAILVRVALVVALLWSGHQLLSLPYAELGSAVVTLCAAAFLAWSSVRVYSGMSAVGLSQLGEFRRLFAYNLGARFGKMMLRSLDNVVVAKMVGVSSVAPYSITATAPRNCETLLNVPAAGLRPAISYVSATAESARLTAHVTRLLRLVLWAGGLGFIGLFRLNEDFVRMWVGQANFAGPAISAGLCLLFLVHVWNATIGTAAFSLGAIQSVSMIDTVSSVALLGGIIVGAKMGGVLGVVLAHLAVQTVVGLWYYPRLIYRRLRWGRHEVTALFREGLNVAIAATVAYLCKPTVDNWLDFVLAAGLITAAYLAVSLALSKPMRGETRHVVLQLLKRGT